MNTNHKPEHQDFRTQKNDRKYISKAYPSQEGNNRSTYHHQTLQTHQKSKKKNSNSKTQKSQNSNSATQEILIQLLSCPSDFSEVVVSCLEDVSMSQTQKIALSNFPNFEAKLTKIFQLVELLNTSSPSGTAMRDFKSIIFASDQKTRIIENLEAISRRHSFSSKKFIRPLSCKEIADSFTRFFGLFDSRLKRRVSKSPIRLERETVSPIHNRPIQAAQKSVGKRTKVLRPRQVESVLSGASRPQWSREVSENAGNANSLKLSNFGKKISEGTSLMGGPLTESRYDFQRLSGLAGQPAPPPPTAQSRGGMLRKSKSYLTKNQLDPLSYQNLGMIEGGYEDRSGRGGQMGAQMAPGGKENVLKFGFGMKSKNSISLTKVRKRAKYRPNRRSKESRSRQRSSSSTRKQGLWKSGRGGAQNLQTDQKAYQHQKRPQNASHTAKASRIHTGTNRNRSRSNSSKNPLKGFPRGHYLKLGGGGPIQANLGNPTPNPIKSSPLSRPNFSRGPKKDSAQKSPLQLQSHYSKGMQRAKGSRSRSKQPFSSSTSNVATAKKRVQISQILGGGHSNGQKEPRNGFYLSNGDEAASRQNSIHQKRSKIGGNGVMGSGMAQGSRSLHRRQSSQYYESSGSKDVNRRRLFHGDILGRSNRPKNLKERRSRSTSLNPVPLQQGAQNQRGGLLGASRTSLSTQKSQPLLQKAEKFLQKSGSNTPVLNLTKPAPGYSEGFGVQNGAPGQVRHHQSTSNLEKSLPKKSNFLVEKINTEPQTLNHHALEGQSRLNYYTRSDNNHSVSPTEARRLQALLKPPTHQHPFEGSLHSSTGKQYTSGVSPTHQQSKKAPKMAKNVFPSEGMKLRPYSEFKEISLNVGPQGGNLTSNQLSKYSSKTKTAKSIQNSLVSHSRKFRSNSPIVSYQTQYHHQHSTLNLHGGSSLHQKSCEAQIQPKIGNFGKGPLQRFGSEQVFESIQLANLGSVDGRLGDSKQPPCSDLAFIQKKVQAKKSQNQRAKPPENDLSVKIEANHVVLASYKTQNYPEWGENGVNSEIKNKTTTIGYETLGKLNQLSRGASVGGYQTDSSGGFKRAGFGQKKWIFERSMSRDKGDVSVLKIDSEVTKGRNGPPGVSRAVLSKKVQKIVRIEKSKKDGNSRSPWVWRCVPGFEQVGKISSATKVPLPGVVESQKMADLAVLKKGRIVDNKQFIEVVGGEDATDVSSNPIFIRNGLSKVPKPEKFGKGKNCKKSSKRSKKSTERIKWDRVSSKRGLNCSKLPSKSPKTSKSTHKLHPQNSPKNQILTSSASSHNSNPPSESPSRIKTTHRLPDNPKNTETRDPEITPKIDTPTSLVYLEESQKRTASINRRLLTSKTDQPFLNSQERKSTPQTSKLLENSIGGDSGPLQAEDESRSVGRATSEAMKASASFIRVVKPHSNSSYIIELDGSVRPRFFGVGEDEAGGRSIEANSRASGVSGLSRGADGEIWRNKKSYLLEYDSKDMALLGRNAAVMKVSRASEKPDSGSEIEKNLKIKNEQFLKKVAKSAKNEHKNVNGDHEGTHLDQPYPSCRESISKTPQICENSEDEETEKNLAVIDSELNRSHRNTQSYPMEATESAATAALSPFTEKIEQKISEKNDPKDDYCAKSMTISRRNQAEATSDNTRFSLQLSLAMKRKHKKERKKGAFKASLESLREHYRAQESVSEACEDQYVSENSNFSQNPDFEENSQTYQNESRRGSKISDSGITHTITVSRGLDDSQIDSERLINPENPKINFGQKSRPSMDKGAPGVMFIKGSNLATFRLDSKDNEMARAAARAELYKSRSDKKRGSKQAINLPQGISKHAPGFYKASEYSSEDSNDQIFGIPKNPKNSTKLEKDEISGNNEDIAQHKHPHSTEEYLEFNENDHQQYEHSQSFSNNIFATDDQETLINCQNHSNRSKLDKILASHTSKKSSKIMFNTGWREAPSHSKSGRRDEERSRVTSNSPISISKKKQRSVRVVKGAGINLLEGGNISAPVSPTNDPMGVLDLEGSVLLKTGDCGDFGDKKSRKNEKNCEFFEDDISGVGQFSGVFQGGIGGAVSTNHLGCPQFGLSGHKNENFDQDQEIQFLDKSGSKSRNSATVRSTVARKHLLDNLEAVSMLEMSKKSKPDNSPNQRINDIKSGQKHSKSPNKSCDAVQSRNMGFREEDHPSAADVKYMHHTVNRALEGESGLAKDVIDTLGAGPRGQEPSKMPKIDFSENSISQRKPLRTVIKVALASPLHQTMHSDRLLMRSSVQDVHQNHFLIFEHYHQNESQLVRSIMKTLKSNLLNNSKSLKFKKTACCYPKTKLLKNSILPEFESSEAFSGAEETSMISCIASCGLNEANRAEKKFPLKDYRAMTEALKRRNYNRPMQKESRDVLFNAIPDIQDIITQKNSNQKNQLFGQDGARNDPLEHPEGSGLHNMLKSSASFTQIRFGITKLGEVQKLKFSHSLSFQEHNNTSKGTRRSHAKQSSCRESTDGVSRAENPHLFNKHLETKFRDSSLVSGSLKQLRTSEVEGSHQNEGSRLQEAENSFFRNKGKNEEISPQSHQNGVKGRRSDDSSLIERNSGYSRQYSPRVESIFTEQMTTFGVVQSRQEGSLEGTGGVRDKNDVSGVDFGSRTGQNDEISRSPSGGFVGKYGNILDNNKPSLPFSPDGDVKLVPMFEQDENFKATTSQKKTHSDLLLLQNGDGRYVGHPQVGAGTGMVTRFDVGNEIQAQEKKDFAQNEIPGENAGHFGGYQATAGNKQEEIREQKGEAYQSSSSGRSITQPPKSRSPVQNDPRPEELPETQEEAEEVKEQQRHWEQHQNHQNDARMQDQPHQAAHRPDQRQEVILPPKNENDHHQADSAIQDHYHDHRHTQEAHYSQEPSYERPQEPHQQQDHQHSRGYQGHHYDSEYQFNGVTSSSNQPYSTLSHSRPRETSQIDSSTPGELSHLQGSQMYQRGGAASNNSQSFSKSSIGFNFLTQTKKSLDKGPQLQDSIYESDQLHKDVPQNGYEGDEASRNGGFGYNGLRYENDFKEDFGGTESREGVRGVHSEQEGQTKQNSQLSLTENSGNGQIVYSGNLEGFGTNQTPSGGLLDSEMASAAGMVSGEGLMLAAQLRYSSEVVENKTKNSEKNHKKLAHKEGSIDSKASPAKVIPQNDPLVYQNDQTNPLMDVQNYSNYDASTAGPGTSKANSKKQHQSKELSSGRHLHSINEAIKSTKIAEKNFPKEENFEPEKIEENNFKESNSSYNTSRESQNQLFKAGRTVKDLSPIPRLYKPTAQQITSPAEANAYFCSEPVGSAVNVNQNNAYRLDIGQGGILAYGGEFLSLSQEIMDPYSSSKTISFIHTDEEKQRQLIKLRVLSDGYILYIDPTTHDAIKVTSSMREVARAKGIPIPDTIIDSAPNFNKYRRTDFCDEGDGEYVLWFRGLNHLAILNVNSMTYTDIPGFWQESGYWCFAMLAVASKGFDKFCGVGFNADQVMTLHVYDTTVLEFMSQPIAGVIGDDVEDIKSMEVSFEQDIIFLGGGEDDDEGIAQLIAITFTAEPKLLAKSKIGPKSMNCIYSLRRLKEGNVLFAGGYGSVCIIYFDRASHSFITLEIYEDLMSDEIADIRFYKHSLYLVSPAHEELAKISFSGEARRSSVASSGVGSLECDQAVVERLKNAFGEVEENNHKTEDEICWIGASQTGQILYLKVQGCLKISAKQPEDDKYVLTSQIPSSVKFRYLREIECNFFAYTTQKTNDFCLIDFQMQEIARIPSAGSQRVPRRYEAISKYSTPYCDTHIFLWAMGATKLAIIDLAANQFDVIEELGGLGLEDPLCHAALSCDSGRRVVSLAVKEETQKCFINYWRKGVNSVISKPVNCIEDEIGSLHSLEINQNQSIIFAVGSSTKKGIGLLVAFSFDSYLDLVAKQEISLTGFDEDFSSLPQLQEGGHYEPLEGLTNITRLKNLDTLVISGGNRVVFSLFTGSKFVTLRVYDGLFRSGVLMFSMWGNELILLSNDRKEVKVLRIWGEFNELFG